MRKTAQPHTKRILIAGKKRDFQLFGPWIRVDIFKAHEFHHAGRRPPISERGLDHRRADPTGEPGDPPPIRETDRLLPDNAVRREPRVRIIPAGSGDFEANLIGPGHSLILAEEAGQATRGVSEDIVDPDMPKEEKIDSAGSGNDWKPPTGHANAKLFIRPDDFARRGPCLALIATVGHHHMLIRRAFVTAASPNRQQTASPEFFDEKMLIACCLGRTLRRCRAIDDEIGMGALNLERKIHR